MLATAAPAYRKRDKQEIQAERHGEANRGTYKVESWATEASEMGSQHPSRT